MNLSNENILWKKNITYMRMFPNGIAWWRVVIPKSDILCSPVPIVDKMGHNRQCFSKTIDFMQAYREPSTETVMIRKVDGLQFIFSSLFLVDVVYLVAIIQ